MKDTQKETAYRECERLTKIWSTGYSLAIKMFPPDVADATYALYAFARTADNIVDAPSPDREALMARQREWRLAWESGRSTDPVLFATADVFRAYDIPFEYSEQFFASMEMDTHISRYDTYADLEQYMDGSAGAVGAMMAHVIGFSDPAALPYARALGHALQLTNFLRDIREDYEVFGRIYIPEADLYRYGVEEKDIRDHSHGMAFRYLMHAYVTKNRALYKEARAGIPFLYPRGRAAVSLAASIYERVLSEIERRDYDVFSSRVSVPSWKKGILALSAAASAGLGQLSF